MILDRRSGGYGRGCGRLCCKEVLIHLSLCQATAQRDEKCAHVFEHFVPRCRQLDGVPTRVLGLSAAFSGL